MSIYQVTADGNECRLKERLYLWSALELDKEAVSIISVTGAGGKTSVMFRLAEELGAVGMRVIVTTTTHIRYPDHGQTVLLNHASQLGQIDWEGQVLIVGGSVKEAPMPGSGDMCRKLGGMDSAETARLAEWCDVLLIEADGSRQLPLKAPADHEPVIIPETDVVIGCAGLTCIGRTWVEACFRPELARELLGKSEDAPESERSSVIRPEDVARILTDQNGTRKQAGDRPYRIVLNQADGESKISQAMQTVREIRQIAEIPVVLTSNLYTSDIKITPAAPALSWRYRSPENCGQSKQE